MIDQNYRSLFIKLSLRLYFCKSPITSDHQKGFVLVWFLSIFFSRNPSIFFTFDIFPYFLFLSPLIYSIICDFLIFLLLYRRFFIFFYVNVHSVYNFSQFTLVYRIRRTYFPFPIHTYNIKILLMIFLSLFNVLEGRHFPFLTYYSLLNNFLRSFFSFHIWLIHLVYRVVFYHLILGLYIC